LHGQIRHGIIIYTGKKKKERKKERKKNESAW
jgi:hypothetical protein